MFTQVIAKDTKDFIFPLWVEWSSPIQEVTQITLLHFCFIYVCQHINIKYIIWVTPQLLLLI